LNYKSNSPELLQHIPKGPEQDCAIVQDIPSTSVNGPEQYCVMALMVQDIPSTPVNGPEQYCVMALMVQDIPSTSVNGPEQYCIKVSISPGHPQHIRKWSGAILH